MVVICKDSNISPPTIPFLSGIVPKWAKNQKLPRNHPWQFCNLLIFNILSNQYSSSLKMYFYIDYQSFNNFYAYLDKQTLFCRVLKLKEALFFKKR